MDSTTIPPVLVVGAGPVGLVAALTLLQNGIPVRIIDKDPNPRLGQRGPGIWPRSLELFHFLNVPDVNDLGKPPLPMRTYKPGTLEPLKDVWMVPYMKPSPAIPFHIPKMLGQQLLDVVLRRHLKKFSCTVEAGTELRSLEQSEAGVTVVLAKNGILETFSAEWIIGTDGAKSAVRKELGLTFMGETRNNSSITGDIRFKSSSLDREHWHQFGTFEEGSVSLRPTDEVGEDGWQFFFISRNSDASKISLSEEFIFKAIASAVPEEVTFNKLVWASDFQTNIRMVNKFTNGRVFVAVLGLLTLQDVRKGLKTAKNSVDIIFSSSLSKYLTTSIKVVSAWTRYSSRDVAFPIKVHGC